MEAGNLLRQIPPVTRIWASGALIVALLVTFRTVDARKLEYSPRLVFMEQQVWRLLTAPLLFGSFSIFVLLHVGQHLVFFKRLEERQFQNRRSALVFLCLQVYVSVLIFSGVFGIYMISDSLLFAFTYIYSKLFSQEMVHFLFIPMPIRMLPIANIIYYLIAGKVLWQLVVGFLSGHVVFYIVFIHPVIIGAPLFRTPRIFRWLFDRPAQ